MLFPQKVTVTHGVTGVDAFASPEDVPPNEILEVPYFDANGNPSRIALVFDAAPTKTVTVDLYTADDSTIPDPSDNDPDSAATLAARRFYLVKTGLVLTAGVLQVVPGPLPGSFYIRVTGDTLVSGTGIIKCGPVAASEVAT